MLQELERSRDVNEVMGYLLLLGVRLGRVSHQRDIVQHVVYFVVDMQVKEESNPR